MTLTFGLLIGGQGSRLGGVAKGLLPLNDKVRVLDRLLDQCRSVDERASICLLGNRTEYIEYERRGLVRLPDNPPGVGPLGGLHALLEFAVSHAHGEVVLLGCDLPYLTGALIQRLLAAPLRSAIAATSGTPPRWEPMLSRYDVRTTLPAIREQLAANALGLFALLERLSAATLTLSSAEAAELLDWDTPEDLARSVP